MIADRYILSAAHCFDDDRDGALDSRFAFPHVAAFELPDRTVLLGISSGEGRVRFPDAWPEIEADLAVIELADEAPADIPRYSLYGGLNEVGRRFVLAGYGRPGHGLTGHDDNIDDRPTKRAGLNRYEGIRDDIPGVDFLVYDFDSGLKENYALAVFGFESDLGFGADEVFQGPRDSGSPNFINGLIAGVSKTRSRLPSADATDELDSSWGEIAFDVRVSAFQEFILQATDNQAMFVVPGDFNADQALTATDIDLLSAAVLDGSHDTIFDLNGDGEVNQLDRSIWVTDIAGTFFGDADLNKEVAFADFLSLSSSFSEPGGWAEGDFDGNGSIQFPDFLLLSANFGKSATAVAVVPEPNAAMLLLLGLVGLVRTRSIVSKKVWQR